MSVAIRYQSRGGHVREMAEIIAEGVEVEPISVDDPRAPITKPVDVLFIGGALYKFKLDPSMEAYIKSIPEGMVRKAIVFGSSATTRRPIYLMQERLKAKGIEIKDTREGVEWHLV
jgi:flavorubredoxin